MSLQKKFIKAAKLLGGEVDRWQGGAARKMGISRSHMHHILTGFRPVTQAMVVELVRASRAEAEALRARADKLDAALADVTMTELGELPLSREQYQRDAAEAEAIINEMAGVTGSVR